MSRAFINIPLCALTVICFSASAFASGLTLLQVETGARSSAMGEAFVAIGGDPLSQHYNPAGAVGGPEFSAYLGHTAYWENVTFQTGFATLRHGKVHYSFGSRLAQVDKLEGRGDVATVDPLYLFETRDISLKFGLAYPVTEKLSLGVAGGWIIEKISFYKSSSVNFDIGGLYAHDSSLTLGASISNIGKEIKLIDTGIALPTTVRVGGAYRMPDFLFALEALHVNDNYRGHLGLEYTRIERLAVRAGFQANYDSKSFTAGLGFSEKDLRIDYAFVPYKHDFGITHQFGLTVMLN